MPFIPCALKAKLPHHKEGGFLINFSFSLLTCFCKPVSFCHVKGIHLPCFHMGPLSPLTTSKEKHFIALAVLESGDLLFAFTSGRAVAGQGLLQWTWHSGTVTRALHCVPLKPLCAAASGALVGWRIPKIQDFPSLSLVWRVLCSFLGEKDIALLCSGVESFPLGCAGNNSVIRKQS